MMFWYFTSPIFYPNKKYFGTAFSPIFYPNTKTIEKENTMFKFCKPETLFITSGNNVEEFSIEHGKVVDSIKIDDSYNSKPSAVSTTLQYPKGHGRVEIDIL